MSSLLRGGRLRTANKNVTNFISSFEDDRRIARSVILVNQAHVIALTKAQVISRHKARRILKALRQLEGQRIPKRGLEDVHVFIEESVINGTGLDIGGLLNLGKSRNDQVTTAVRMTLREEILELSDNLLSLAEAMLSLAQKHTETVFPGYTHLQPAQPISFAHYLVANVDSLLRNSYRIIEAYHRINCSPMGAAALAGTSFRLNRDLIASLLGFNGLMEISLDAVGSRDFLLETLCVCSLIASDLSRIAQDLIFYSSAESSLIALPDEFASTSSIMPHKKNPDPLELVRAKCARIAGNPSVASTILHGLPSGYNLDFQEITPLSWQSIDELKSCLRIMTELIPKIEVDKEIALRQYLEFTAATEIANVLVREEGTPFRLAHRVVGSAVRTALQQSKTLKSLSRKDWEGHLHRRIKPRTVSLMERALNLKTHLWTYQTKGSPNPREMRNVILRRKRECTAMREESSQLHQSIRKRLEALSTAASGISGTA